MTKAHKGQILALKNQVIPLDENTTFYAPFDHDLNGRDAKGRVISPVGFESSVDFNGTTSYIRAPQNLQGQFTTAITVEAWVFPKINTGNVQGIVSQWVGSTDGSCMLYQNQDKFSFIVRTSPTTSAGTQSLSIAQYNRWYHVVGSYNGAQVELYVDGVLVSSSALTGGIIGTYPVVIGAYSNTTSFVFNGRISDVRLWNVRRSSIDIKSNMNRILNGDEPGLVSYWKMNEVKDSIVYDSANGYDALGSNIGWSNGRTVATMRPIEGKFNGGVAVESSTNNMIVNGDLSNGLVGHAVANSSNTNGTVQHTIFKSYTCCYLNAGKWDLSKYFIANYPTVTVGQTYTVSFYIYALSTNVIRFDPNGGWNDGFNIHPKVGEWQRYEYTFTPSVTAAGTLNFYAETDSNYIELYITNFQMEQKNFSTSFVDGSRPQGKIQYPNTLYGQANGTINFWLRYPDYLPTTSAIWLEIYDGVSGATEWIGISSDATKLNPFNVSRTAYHSTWNMYTIVKVGDTLTCYINGIQTASRTNTTTIPNFFNGSALVTIGSRYDGNYIANFILDELRMDKVARTVEEIQSWYLSGAPFYNPSDRIGVIK